MVSPQSLKLFIERKRKVMIQAAKHYGMNAEITVKHSQELDELLNQYGSIVRKNEDSYQSNYHLEYFY